MLPSINMLSLEPREYICKYFVLGERTCLHQVQLHFWKRERVVFRDCVLRRGNSVRAGPQRDTKEPRRESQCQPGQQ